MNEVFEEVRAALYSAWARKWLVLGVAWGVCLAGWLVVAMIPNAYESKAKIFVQLDDILTKQTGIAGSDKSDIQRVRQTLTAVDTLQKVVRSTQLGEGVTTPQQMEREVGSLAEAVKVKSEEDNLFEITATIGKGHLSDAENARLSQDVVRKLLDVFREENIAGNRGDVAEAVAVLDQQLQQRAKELEAAEARLTAFEAEHPELIGGASAINGRLNQTRTELRGVEADIAAAQSALAAINGQIAGTPATLPGVANPGSASGAYAQAQAQVAQLRARGLKNTHPDMQAAIKQMELLRQQAAREGGGGAGGVPNPAYSSLISIRGERQANLQALLARKAAMQADISMSLADQASEPALAAEAQRIGRDYEVLKTKYDELLQDREELELRSNLESERSSFRFDIIDAPALPLKPAAPNRPILLLGVLIVGIGAGVGSAFALTQLKSTFATTAGLERAMGLPVLGSISTSLTPTQRVQEAKKTRMFFAGSAALGGVLVILMAIEFIQVGSVA
ncbi:XrtA system polysaccharide chain length determinant [Erythrobacter litoralis]|uniref:Chain length determinant protein n=1 Tax=Erythrobacter litoralis (strain HTCC2594) TaxID=314225 RepID=Q2NA28_ERYLH|nr:XrtA system polysaccharide chain length determinant [Erythrobacter litoralis]ABC63463.1 Chain length determinant protein [Erythrobacter litoralis HTCC2594]